MSDRPSFVLEEWCRRVFAVPDLDDADLRLIQRLQGERGQPRLRVTWLHDDSISVQSSSWVGLVRFSGFDLHVIPKLVGGSLKLLRMLDYAGGLGLLKRLEAGRPLPAGHDLLDLVVLVLVEETRSLMRSGLLRDYRPVDDSLPTLRGRLRSRDQVLRRYGQLQALECSFDEYDGNVVENQLLAAAFHAVRRRVRDDGLRAACAQLCSVLDSVCTVHRTDADWYEQRIVYGRRNGAYRAAHELALLVLRACAFDDSAESSGSPFAFMINMNTVFERFLTRLLRDAHSGTDIICRSQSSLTRIIMDHETGKPYQSVRPDIVIEHPRTGRSVPIDVKYKLYANKKLEREDVYQLFLYAYALATDASNRRAGLLYPATAATSGPSLSIRSNQHGEGAVIAGTGLDIPAILEALASTDRSSLYAEIRAVVDRLCGFRTAFSPDRVLQAGSRPGPAAVSTADRQWG